MATRVDAPKEVVKNALELALASNKRALNNLRNPGFRPIIELDISVLQNAINTLQETK